MSMHIGKRRNKPYRASTSCKLQIDLPLPINLTIHATSQATSFLLSGLEIIYRNTHKREKVSIEIGIDIVKDGPDKKAHKPDIWYDNFFACSLLPHPFFFFFSFNINGWIIGQFLNKVSSNCYRPKLLTSTQKPLQSSRNEEGNFG